MMRIEKLNKDHFLIKALIESYREEWQRGSGQRDKERRKYFYMSDVSKCDREIYYLFHHPEQKRTIADKTLILFNLGNLQHEEIQFRLKKKRIIDASRDIEFGLEDWEIEATGRLDSFVKDNGDLTILEIKAKNPYGFLGEEPESYEVDQILWYIFAARNSKSLKKRKVNNFGYILYVEGWPISDFPMAGWRVYYDEERIEKIRQRFRNLKINIEAKKIPQRSHERNSIKCQYCRFLDFCWRDVPIAEEPEIIADPNVEKPEQELVESAEQRYVKLQAEIRERERELKGLKELLLKYCRATGAKETELLQFIQNRTTRLDEEYLYSQLAEKWHLISKPQIKLIQEAIKKGELDPEIFERAKRINFSLQIRIKKGVLNANQKLE